VPGSVPETVAFQILTDQTADTAVEIPITGYVDLFSQINQMNVNFTAYEFGADNPININIIALNLTIQAVHPVPSPTNVITVDNTDMTVINSYVSVDWTSVASNFVAKNAFNLVNGANLYMYNMTISEDENNPPTGVIGKPDFEEIPLGAEALDYVPYRVEAGSEAYYFKWLETSVTDKYDMAVPGATVNTTFDFTQQTVVNQVSRINKLTTTDTDMEWKSAKKRMTDYLGAMYGITPANFNVTRADGKAMLPLLSTYFNSTNYPNGDHVGEYDVRVRYTGSAGAYGTADFQPVPNILSEDNFIITPIQLTDIALTRPFGSPGLIVNASRVVSMNGGVSESLSVNDFIIVENNGILTLSNANLQMAYSGSAPFKIVVRDNGQLIMNNVDLTTQGNMAITVTLEDNAKFTMTDSSTTQFIDILASNSAQVTFNRTIVGGNFDTATSANVKLAAWSTSFGRNLDSLTGTSEALLVGCYSPLSPNFKIEPSDSAKVWLYRWVEVTVYDGTSAANKLQNAHIWLATQYPEWGATLNRAGATNSAGLYVTTGLSDYFRYDAATSEVVESHYNLYSLVTEYQLNSPISHNETTGLGLAAYPLMSQNDATAKRSVVLENVLPDLDPPLTVWPLETGSGVGRGNEILINTTVTNIGDATANGITVWFEDTFAGHTTNIYTTYSASIAPGASWDISFPYTWDSVDEIGWHNITVTVDPTKVIKEQDETNNFNYTLINVTSQSDLAILQYFDVWASETYPLINQQFRLYANVWNLGDIDATDVPVSFYQNGTLLGNVTAATVPANPTAPTVVSIPVTFTHNGTYFIEVIIDEENLIPEVDETNNNNSQMLYILRVYEHPDLFIQNIQIIAGTNLVEANIGGGTPITETYNRTHVILRARVHNQGDLFASSVFVRFYNGAPTTANLIGTSNIIPSISTGNFAYAMLTWEAMTNGLQQVHNINAIAYANAGLVSNQENQTLTVLDNRPDLDIVNITLSNNATRITGNTVFNLNVTVTNNGLWTANKVAVDVYSSMNAWNSTRAGWNSGTKIYIGRIGNPKIATLVNDETAVVKIACKGVDAGIQNLFINVDPDLNSTDRIPYDNTTKIIGLTEEYNEQNNNQTFTVTAIIPPLRINIQLPEPTLLEKKWTNVYTEGKITSILVTGFVVRVDNPGIGVPGIQVNVSINDGTPVPVTSAEGGFFSITMPVPAVGNYTLDVTGNGIIGDSTWFRVDPPITFPWWIIILIVILVVAVIVGITLYLYFVGLGKTVQCGECGAFIAEGAAKCPKCGVEFETEVAKCSVCGAWVPIDVKNCPECGTEFTVGTEDLDDYEAKMKRQYDDIVRKFRDQAKAELGQEFTETEFQAWWASKPTFITFDLWLKEEEEMKRMGARPCPVCERENSVTAKICHTCGSVMGPANAAPPKKPEGKLPPGEKKPEAKPTQAQPKQQPPTSQPVAPQQQQQTAAAPVPAQQGTPGKKSCPSCGMEVNAEEKVCPICNYDFGQAPAEGGDQVRRIVRKPIKKIVRRPGEGGGDQQQP
jgi:RNA polymerase subunit RPABC4/transcription elongation factor Spt4